MMCFRRTTGAVTTLAGSAEECGAADGAGATARFRYPSGITTDGTSLYVADTNSGTIRKVTIATGVVTTLAGRAGASGNRRHRRRCAIQLSLRHHDRWDKPLCGGHK